MATPNTLTIIVMVAVAFIGIVYFLSAFNVMQPTAPANNTTVGQQYNETTSLISSNIPWIPALLLGIVGFAIIRIGLGGD